MRSNAFLDGQLCVSHVSISDDLNFTDLPILTTAGIRASEINRQIDRVDKSQSLDTCSTDIKDSIFRLALYCYLCRGLFLSCDRLLRRILLGVYPV